MLRSKYGRNLARLKFSTALIANRNLVGKFIQPERIKRSATAFIRKFNVSSFLFFMSQF
jgi:hypothetical protein